MSAPLFLTLAPLFFLPESPRWLLKRGKEERFVSTMRRAAKMNKVGMYIQPQVCG